MKYRGVNLGGWLVLERWITPSLYEGMQAKDETDFMLESGHNAASKIDQHRKSYITEDDIAWIAAHGLNAIRLPVPHWAFGDVTPYVGCIQYVDWLMDMALKHGLSVLIDIHTAPGSQNGWAHSGVEGPVKWHTDSANIAQILEFTSKLAERYADHGALMGIELLNEPNPSIPQDVLIDFYLRGMDVVKNINLNTRVIVSDAFRPEKWGKTFLRAESNVALDLHLYQAFDAADKKLSMQKHIRKAQHDWYKIIEKVQKTTPVIIGEWSLGLDNHAFKGMDDFERDKALQAYGAAQLEVFDNTNGWFFWNYKTETMAAWSYRECISRGWLPKLKKHDQYKLLP